MSPKHSAALFWIQLRRIFFAHRAAALRSRPCSSLRSQSSVYAATAAGFAAGCAAGRAAKNGVRIFVFLSSAAAQEKMTIFESL
jgi:hypothetical protein